MTKASRLNNVKIRQVMAKLDGDVKCPCLVEGEDGTKNHDFIFSQFRGKTTFYVCRNHYYEYVKTRWFKEVHI